MKCMTEHVEKEGLVGSRRKVVLVVEVVDQGEAGSLVVPELETRIRTGKTSHRTRGEGGPQAAVARRGHQR